jgi:hypothetical protein
LRTIWRSTSDHDEAKAEGRNRNVEVKLGMSVPTLYAYVDTKGQPRERVNELLGRREVRSKTAV